MKELLFRNKRVSFSFIAVLPSSRIAITERTELHVFKNFVLRILLRLYRGHQDFLNEVKVRGV